MITFRTCSELPVKDLVGLWNKGFEGYFVPVSLTVDSFISRTANEGLSLDHSIVAFHGELPVGFIVNGFRDIQGKRIAWNGGTGIIPDYRGKGIGKKLMEQTLHLYREHGVHTATLEAIAQNEKAIRLYESAGYQTTERLLLLQCLDSLSATAFDSIQQESSSPHYSCKTCQPHELAALPFYRGLHPWQTQWQSVKGGEALIAYDFTGQAAGYSLFRRVYDAQGHLSSIILYQCEADEAVDDQKHLVSSMLEQVFQPQLGACKRMAYNLPQSNRIVVETLLDRGFTLHMEQVYMLRSM